VTTPPKRAPLGADLIIPGLALGFAIYFFVSIDDLAWEAKANGVLVGSILIALVLVQFARIGVKIARGAGDFSFSALLQPRDALTKRILLVVLTVVFIASALFLLAGAAVLARPSRTLLRVSVAMAPLLVLMYARRWAGQLSAPLADWAGFAILAVPVVAGLLLLTLSALVWRELHDTAESAAGGPRPQTSASIK